jgi:tRNA-2-methylthio-N6-dimethylallyladenosine synthase
VRRLFDAGETHVLAVDRQREGSTYDYFSDITAVRKSNASAWVTIIEGCDYFCTYCVVPYTRGRQISRSPESILEEIQTLASEGYKEFTLLGQTVDAYGKDFKDRHYDLADLFQAVSAIPGVARIRFMTSHPLDLSDRIIEAIATLPNVMPYIHIPMQAGNTEILARMKRGYTAEAYYTLVDKIYDRIPNVAVTGDYIVGFPGETEAQFQDSIFSVSRARKHAANTAAYSPRKQTPAGIWETRGEGVISDEEKQDRLQRLNAAITEESAKQNAVYHHTRVTLLVEGPSRRNPNRLMGRTPQNKVVNFDLLDPQTNRPLPPEAVARCINYLMGQLIEVLIIDTAAWALLGAYEVPMPLLEVMGYIGCEEHQLV